MISSRTKKNRSRLIKIKVADIEGEIWADVAGYEGFYSVSNMGRIKSLLREVSRKNGGTVVIPERILKSSSIYGYRQVVLMKNSIAVTHRVHRLVASAFLHNYDNKPHVNHINGVRYDNRIENLEWCTESENIYHTYDSLGRIPIMGEQVNTNKLTPEQVLEIRGKYIPRKYSCAKLGKEYGVDASAISLIIRRKNWKHI